MLAAKFHDDLFYNNAYYSKLGGLSLNELNHLESELLHLLDFSLFVQEVAYCKYSMQLQNYVFYLEVVPSPRCPCSEAVGRGNSAQNKMTFAQVPAQGMSVAPARSVPQQQSVRYINTECPGASTGPGVGSIRIPSPDNPHARAGSFSENYLCANSPLRIAPASVSHAQVQAYARPQQQLLVQQQHHLVQQQAQQQAQQQTQLLAQRYAHAYFARDPTAPMPAPRARSPVDYTSYDTCAGAGLDDNFAMLASSFNAGTYPSLADSMDDTTTVCSTRTASPYPALGCRSTSSSNMMQGVSTSGGPALAAHTPHVYPACGSLNSVPAQNVPIAWSDHYASQRSYNGRSDLRIVTDGLMDGHVDSTPTPYPTYHHQQRAVHGQGSIGYLHSSVHGSGSNSGSGSGSAMHTPSGYYPHSAVQTPTERLYSNSSRTAFSFTPAPAVYGHGYNQNHSGMPAGSAGTAGANECENVTTPRDYYTLRYSAPPARSTGHEAQYLTPPRTSPYPMLYAPTTCASNVNINMHNASLSDPMNFYGYGAGVYAGQM